MKCIETEFTKALLHVMIKHKKTFTSDKNGIFIVDDNCLNNYLISVAEVASEDSRNKLITVYKT